MNSNSKRDRIILPIGILLLIGTLTIIGFANNGDKYCTDLENCTHDPLGCDAWSWRFYPDCELICKVEGIHFCGLY